MGAALLEISAPKFAEAISSRLMFKTAARKNGKQVLLKNSGVVAAAIGVQADTSTRNLQNKPVNCEETFPQILQINHFKQF